MKITIDDREDYRFLKGKHEGIKLALDILKNNVHGQDVNLTYNNAKFGTSNRGAIRWLTNEKGIIEYRIELLEKKMYATTYKPMTMSQKAGWPFTGSEEE